MTFFRSRATLRLPADGGGYVDAAACYLLFFRMLRDQVRLFRRPSLLILLFSVICV